MCMYMTTNADKKQLSFVVFLFFNCYCSQSFSSYVVTGLYWIAAHASYCTLQPVGCWFFFFLFSVSM